MKKIYFIALIICIITLSFEFSNTNIGITQKKYKIAYIQYDTIASNPYSGLTSIRYCDQHDTVSKEILGDKYYILNLTWSPTGNEILFSSARLGDPQRLKILQYHAQEQLYLLDLKSKAIKLVFNGDSNPDTKDLEKFTGLQWDANGNRIFFSNDDNKIYSLKDGLVSTFYQLEEKYEISDMLLSNDDHYLALQYFSLDFIFGISVINLETQKIEYKYEIHKGNGILGWSNDNCLYISDGELKKINDNDWTVEPADIRIDPKQYVLERMYFINDYSAIMELGIKIYLPNYVVAYSSNEKLIGIYNKIEGKFSPLIKDKHKKTSLSVLIE